MLLVVYLIHKAGSDRQGEKKKKKKNTKSVDI